MRKVLRVWTALHCKHCSWLSTEILYRFWISTAWKRKKEKNKSSTDDAFKHKHKKALRMKHKPDLCRSLAAGAGWGWRGKPHQRRVVGSLQKNKTATSRCFKRVSPYGGVPYVGWSFGPDRWGSLDVERAERSHSAWPPEPSSAAEERYDHGPPSDQLGPTLWESHFLTFTSSN